MDYTRRRILRNAIALAGGAAVCGPGLLAPGDRSRVSPVGTASQPWPVIELVGVGRVGQQALRNTIHMLRRMASLEFFPHHPGAWTHNNRLRKDRYEEVATVLFNLGGTDAAAAGHARSGRADLVVELAERDQAHVGGQSATQPESVRGRQASITLVSAAGHRMREVSLTMERLPVLELGATAVALTALADHQGICGIDFIDVRRILGAGGAAGAASVTVPTAVRIADAARYAAKLARHRSACADEVRSLLFHATTPPRWPLSQVVEALAWVVDELENPSHCGWAMNADRELGGSLRLSVITLSGRSTP